MKNIPHRKTKNVFQFKSFRERIAEIDIRRTTLYHISHENELLEGDQSNFHEAVQKWSVLNMSEEFQQFIIPIRSVVTLPQLLHKKVFIFEHLSDCLKNASNLSLQALLEILVALAKDLRAEFCSFFFQFFDQLIIILDSREPDNLEYTFLCLASLFKIMRGFLRKKLEQVFERLVLLLEDSRPLYVTNFAAECFGFLARDVLNKKELLHMISVAVGSNSNVTMGCGRLVFEIMRGTNGQFHSCAEQYWRLLLLEMIIEEPNEKTGFKPQCLFDILIQTVTDMLHCIEPDNMEPFWIIMNTALENHLAHNPISNETAFHYILQLIGLIVEHQHGKHLRNVSCIVGKLIKTISGTNTEEILSTVSKIASVMLLSKNVIITRLEVSRLTKNILTLGHRSRRVFEEFVLNVSDCEMFDVLVLPDCLKYMEKTFDSRSIQLLMQIIARKSNPCKSGIELNNWKPIQIQLKSNEAVMKIKQVIDGGQQVENRDEFIACIVLLPHLKDFEIDNKILHRLEEEVYRTLTTIETDMEDCYIPVLSVLIETLVHINYPEIHLYVETVKRLLPVINSRKKEPLINIVNMCLVQISYTESDLLNDELFNVVHAHLCEFLASEHSRTRLLVTHSFTLFRGASIFLNTGSETLFDVLYSIESVEPDIHNYRKHVMLLKKLEFNASLLQCIKKPEFRVDAMRTVISLLSINFNLLWKPASEVLQTYADGFSITDFWHVYKQQLNCTLNVVSDNSTLEVNEKMHKTNNQELQSDDYKKIDYVNYRIQLLNNLAKFNRIFEAKNRDIVESFFRFMDKEYRTKKTADKTNEDTSKALLKIIIAYLNIFSGVRNPGTIFKSQQLYETFMEFLCHRNSEVQRLALSCIFTYENPAFIPYKETLYRLNCNKSFKQEIAVFFTKSASEGNELRCIVQDEHRVEVIPMVMKILHTKMIQKTTSPELKKLIIRFIGNFRENEIKLFMNMSFACYEKCLMAHALETYTFIVTKNPKVESFSIHRLQALILLIDNIFDEFAAVKNESFVRYLLHIKFCMDTTLLQMEHSLVKHLKSQATLNMVKLFDHFDNYHWSEEEIQAVFSIYVWPQLNKLENDCIHSPTPLLKLFSIWSKSLRYFPLLVKSSEASYTPLEKVISLLSSGKASDIVCREICKMINNMLSLELTDNENSYELPTKNTLISAHKDMNKKRNPGCLLLSSYFVNILRYIQKVLKQNKSISKDLLNILSCVSECTREDILCDTLTDMLFPMTIQKSLHPNIDIETLREMHHVLLKMLKLVSRPEKHMRKIGLLLERVNDLVARKCILQMIDLLVEKCNDPQLARCASILHDMNAMDKRWLDQPDFNRRLNAFRKVDELTNEQDAIRVELTIWIVHQCFYYLKTDHDLAIRDRANQFLQTNVSQCIKMQSNSDQRESVQYLIERVVLPAIIRGVKDKNGSVKYESIQLIGQFSRQCADYHSVFADLHPFTNEKDREIDFFENMTHLQSHRHRRALKRFCKILKTLEKPPSIRTLVNFVLPIVSTYLCNDVYKKKAKLTEAAAKCVILIGRLQPWPGYKSLLKQYLNKMKHNIEYQKQLIKIVVGLLDNFNYDLLKANRDNSSSQILGINTISKERGECRRVILDYLVGYPLGSNVEHTVNFYVSQLEYEVLSGRESAVLMLQAMFKSFPLELLSKKGNYLFYALGIRLINEKSTECRMLIATGLETLLSVMTKNQRDSIANIILVMICETKLSERELAAQFLLRMINVEKEAFILRVEKILPALLNSMMTLQSESAGKFVLLKQIEKQDYGEEFQELKDHSLYQILNVFGKLFEVCPEIIIDEKYANLMDELAYTLQSLLSYGHQWIRYVSLQLIGAFLAGIDSTAVDAILKGQQCPVKHQFIYSNPSEEIRSLVLDMCTQLNPGQTDEETACLITKNFVLLCYIVVDVPLKSSNERQCKEINLSWIIRRVRYVIQSEVSKAPKSIILRNNMFDLFDSIIDLTNFNVMCLVAPSMMAPLLRELNDKAHLNENLKSKIESLMRKIKTKIGIEHYDVICLDIRTKIENKCRVRHLSKAIEKINNPIQATKRKQALKDRKKLVKKRKIEEQKNSIHRTTKRAYKTRRLEDLFKN
ncbi:small subunit processome component 20 homolog isoform X3 [Wyeomyia smithii]|uniref:small subunit processome component 20 homolog isoform X3 n=1 Tax=Wyeomyia smithii TaxID=174621 RepID=UPI0024680555|nr:small subunit processome component 20 homolog isoform X3 [Wyeomyia smithii]